MRLSNISDSTWFRLYLSPLSNPSLNTAPHLAFLISEGYHHPLGLTRRICHWRKQRRTRTHQVLIDPSPDWWQHFNNGPNFTIGQIHQAVTHSPKLSSSSWDSVFLYWQTYMWANCDNDCRLSPNSSFSPSFVSENLSVIVSCAHCHPVYMTTFPSFPCIWEHPCDSVLTNEI